MNPLLANPLLTLLTLLLSFALAAPAAAFQMPAAAYEEPVNPPQFQWHTFYGTHSALNGSMVDFARDVALDGSGSVYIVGQSRNNWRGPDQQNPLHGFTSTDNGNIVVMKLGSSGQYLWHTFYGSTSDDEGIGIACDSNGNIFVTGRSTLTWNGPNGETPLHAHSLVDDLFVMKLSSSGAYLWHTFYGSINDDTGQEIAADPANGNVYITGSSEASWNGPAGQAPLHAHSGRENDIAVLKLNGTGAYLWHTFYGSTTLFASTQGFGLALDSSNVYIVGTSSNSWNGPAGQAPKHAFTSQAITVLKINSSGAYQWHTFYGAANYPAVGYGIALGSSSDIYVTGISNEGWNGPGGVPPLHAFTGTSYNITVLKLNSSADYQWHTFYGAIDEWNFAYEITTDQDSNLFVVGNSSASWYGPGGETPLNDHSNEDEDIVLLKLNSSGAYQWHTFYGYIKDDLGTGIVSNASGEIFVAGSSNYEWDGPADQLPLHAGPSNEADIVVIRMTDRTSSGYPNYLPTILH